MKLRFVPRARQLCDGTFDNDDVRTIDLNPSKRKSMLTDRIVPFSEQLPGSIDNENAPRHRFLSAAAASWSTAARRVACRSAVAAALARCVSHCVTARKWAEAMYQTWGDVEPPKIPIVHPAGHA